MIFFDFEVFKYDWLVVAIDTDDQSETIIHNNKESLVKLYEKNVKNIWVGHNVVHYDQFIAKGIMLDMDPKYINDKIIVDGLDGWQISSEFNKIPMILYDTLLANNKSLKTLEGFMGNNIKETDVPFDIDRPLTKKELQMTIQYCRHDVEQDIEVFMRQINEFNASMSLIQMFSDTLSLRDLYRTKPQLSAKILECEKQHHDDQFDVFVLPCIDIKKYKDAVEFFLNPDNHWYKKGKKKNEFNIVIAGLEHTLGWGGIHGAKEKYHNKGVGRIILHVDVASFYPRLMIFWNLLTRNCKRPDKFKEIFERRLQLKREGKKAEQAPLKIVINSTYGMCKDKTSQAYDPRQSNLITMNGQLMLVDLIEHLEAIPDFELIQSNTDGLIISIPDIDEHFDMVDDICYEWEQRCRMELEFDEIDWIYQKDVNNYVCKFSNGEIERKGAYVKELGSLDYDLPIVNEAIVKRLSDDTPVEVTINNCNEFIKFQKVVKLSSKYEYVTHNDKKYTYKCYRVFASKDKSDGSIFKIKKKIKAREEVLAAEKFANTPKSCFIFNDDVNMLEVPDNLDLQWYIDLANKRLKDFGVE